MLPIKDPLHTVLVPATSNDHAVIRLRRAYGPPDGCPPVLHHIPPISAGQQLQHLDKHALKWIPGIAMPLGKTHIANGSKTYGHM